MIHGVSGVTVELSVVEIDEQAKMDVSGVDLLGVSIGGVVGEGRAHHVTIGVGVQLLPVVSGFGGFGSEG